MRRLLSVVTAGMFTLCLATPAYAAGSGQIDHVEVDAEGSVKMLYAVPGLSDGVTPDLDSVYVEVAGRPVDATASPVEAGEVERTAVLALDVSASMRGERFEAAKRAAGAFLGAAPDDVAIGLVTFAGSVSVVAEPTTDHAGLAQTIDSLSLARGTRLYDGLQTAIDTLDVDGQRQVLVLSDGADTGSTPLPEAVTAAEESGVTVDVVALQQSQANQAKLRQITAATGGAVLPADDPTALETVFARAALALGRQVLIEFDSPIGGEATVTASIDASGRTYTDSSFVSLSAATTSSGGANGPVPASPPSIMLDERFLFGGAAALGLGLAVVIAILLLGKPREQDDLVARQLSFYSSHSPTARGTHSAAAGKPSLDVRGSAVAVAHQIVKSGGFEERLTQRLTAAGLALTAAEWVLLHAAVIVASGLVGLLVSGGSLMMTGLLLLLGVVGPWVFLGIRESRRLKAFNSQLADTLQLMSGGLSAGLSLPQAVDTVVREGAEPMSSELRRSLVEQRLGVDIEDALEGVAERMQSKDFSWVVMAIRIQREIGGNLAELLNTVAATIREREYLRRQVRTLSAEGRLSAWILGLLPPIFVVYLALTNPVYLTPLYTTMLGLLMSGAGFILMTVGVFWLKGAVKVEV